MACRVAHMRCERETCALQRCGKALANGRNICSRHAAVQLQDEKFNDSANPESRTEIEEEELAKIADFASRSLDAMQNLFNETTRKIETDIETWKRQQEELEIEILEISSELEQTRERKQATKPRERNALQQKIHVMENSLRQKLMTREQTIMKLRQCHQTQVNLAKTARELFQNGVAAETTFLNRKKQRMEEI
jgi:vacuolar-type H+-ATPase subunit I/STV1